MRYALAIRERDYNQLVDHLFSRPDRESAAYLLCRFAKSESEVLLLVREFIPVADQDILAASSTHMKIASRPYVPAIKRARIASQGFVFTHSHPLGAKDHSAQDDSEEKRLFRTVYQRAPTGVHASLVFENRRLSGARVWTKQGGYEPISRVRVVGDRIAFRFQSSERAYVPEFFDRQVRAFGTEFQSLLAKLNVGVVGLGGTGSSVVEQLGRLGVGGLTLCDPEVFEPSNVNRVYGSRSIDAGLPKTKITERLLADIGLRTEVTLIPKSVTYESAIRQLRMCDMVFGCTDDYWGRSLLSRLAVYYYLPVFDMGVKVDSKEGVIRSIQGRVTTLLPGTACLFCRSRISPLQVLAQEKWELKAAEAEQLVREGYIPGLNDPAPAVIPFTSAVAATAISEMIHRLTGFLGGDRKSSEVLHLIDETRLRTNRVPPRDECFCTTDQGRGDTSPLLGVTWRSE